MMQGALMFGVGVCAIALTVMFLYDAFKRSERDTGDDD